MKIVKDRIYIDGNEEVHVLKECIELEPSDTLEDLVDYLEKNKNDK